LRSRIYKPASVATVALACVVAVVRFSAIDATSHSASDTLRPWAIEVFVIASVAVLAIAALRRLTRQPGS